MYEKSIAIELLQCMSKRKVSAHVRQNLPIGCPAVGFPPGNSPEEHSKIWALCFGPSLLDLSHQDFEVEASGHGHCLASRLGMHHQ